MRRFATLGLFLTVLVFITVTPASGVAGAGAQVTSSSGVDTTSSVLETSLPTTTTPPVESISGTQLKARSASTLLAQNTATLADAIANLVAASGASAGVSLVDLGGTYPGGWSLNAGGVFTAASTYKLAALMMEAQNIAIGNTDPNGVVCFEPDDYEAGWFDDYAPGACFTRNELATRAGMESDNTAGHMLVRDLGGAAALNAWAASAGAANSAFFDGNTTAAEDLTALWVAEADGSLGGSAAQAWLYPRLTQTKTEAGIPAGVAAGGVVHKTGTIDAVVNDTALILNGPGGAYVLTVMTDGLGGDAGWQLIAAISAAVWTFESARPS